jgi:nucleoside-diphosphate-sugar epimerase
MPITPYAKSKAKSFQLLLDNSLSLGIELFYLRIFSAFGEGQYHQNLWPALKHAALSGEDFKLTSGSQIRDFISVSDVAKAFKNAATAMEFNGTPMILNVGSGIGLSVKEFANLWWRSHGAKGNLIFDAIPQRGDEPDRYIADIKIEKELGLFGVC